MKKLTTLVLLALSPSVGMAGGVLTVNGAQVGTYDSAQSVNTDVTTGNVAITATNFVPTASGTGGGTNPPATYTIGGTVSGLTASGLTLLNNGADALSISSGATSFTFPIATNTYNVTVSSQPTGLSCSISNGSGTATTAVSNVSVTCSASSSSNPPPANVTLQTVTYPVSAKTYTVPAGGILAFPFTPLANQTYKNISTTYSSTYNTTTRSVWLSTTPGGTTLPNNPACAQSGLETSIYYSTATNMAASGLNCQLQANTQYYINVQNPNPTDGSKNTCPAGASCTFVLTTNAPAN